MIGAIHRDIAELAMMLEIFPGGSTRFILPFDVGADQPFKAALKAKWEAWIDSVGVDKALITSPSREEFTQWIIDRWQSLPLKTIYSSWQKENWSLLPLPAPCMD
jgi:hypothetical protein